MHTKEEVGLFLLAREDGMSVAEAAAFVGVGGGAARSWDAGMLPHSYTGRPWDSCRIGGGDARTTRGEPEWGRSRSRGRTSRPRRARSPR